MYTILTKIKAIAFFCLLITTTFCLLLSSCNNKNSSENEVTVKNSKDSTAKEEHTGEHGEEAPAAIAELTQEQIKTVGITYGSIEMKELTATIKVNGNLRVPNNNKANATSLYGGVIKNLNVQIGNFVRKGEVIATIANPQFISLQEEYLTTGSKIIFAEQELQRQKELNEGNAGAKKNLQSAISELNTLRTRRASLQKQIQLMGINPNSVSNSNLTSALVVTSPISGTVSNVFAKMGSYVDVSSPVAEIVDNGALHLDLNVFEKDLPVLKVGQTIHFTVTNNPANEYDAVIYSIGTAFESNSKTIPVHCTVKGTKTGLIDGMNITAIVSLTNILTPAVPSEAIVSADGKEYIFVVTNKKAEKHHDEEEEKHAKEKDDDHKTEDGVSFEKIEVAKGVSNLGYTAITPVTEISKDAKIVIKGAFFINAKLSNTGDHGH
jgi:membrane fusion protein, heavy metal efflux system